VVWTDALGNLYQPWVLRQHQKKSISKMIAKIKKDEEVDEEVDEDEKLMKTICDLKKIFILKI